MVVVPICSCLELYIPEICKLNTTYEACIPVQIALAKLCMDVNKWVMLNTSSAMSIEKTGMHIDREIIHSNSSCGPEGSMHFGWPSPS